MESPDGSQHPRRLAMVDTDLHFYGVALCAIHQWLGFGVSRLDLIAVAWNRAMEPCHAEILPVEVGKACIFSDAPVVD